MAPIITEHRFRAMASDVQFIAVGATPDALVNAEDRIRLLEARWSRFLGDSDISRINRANGTPVKVSDDTVLLCSAMAEAAAITNGRFDPTMAATMVRLGYQSSIDDPQAITVVAGIADSSRSMADVHVDPLDRVVHAPAGLGLDPGGLGKGLAADIVVNEALAAKTAGMLVSIGGDLVARGEAPDTGWLVEIDHPLQPEGTVCTIAIEFGAVATSSTVSRTWDHEGIRRHHVIDPYTGRVSTTDLATVTAVAATGWQAEVAATIGLLAGSAGVIAALDSDEIQGMAIALDGRLLSTGGFTQVMAETAPCPSRINPNHPSLGSKS